MKANDLMVGDYVYNHRNWECLIVEIHKNSAVVIAKHYGEEEFFLSDLRPIPLTPEILEKNGFKQIGEKFIWGEIDDDLIEINPSINNSYRITVSVADLMISCSIWCSNVLRLQHALRLCGIEKEIEL